MTSEERFAEIVRQLLAGNLAEAQELVRTCGDDAEHEWMSDSALSESLSNLSAMCKIGIAMQTVQAERESLQ